jgi:hypothetical protein
MKDKAILAHACKMAGQAFVEQGQTVRFTGGRLNNAVLDLKTGRISGDTDYGHTSDGLGELRQTYSEVLYKNKLNLEGIAIESRTVNAEGNVVLMYSAG